MAALLDLSAAVFLGFFASRFDFLWPLAITAFLRWRFRVLCSSGPGGRLGNYPSVPRCDCADAAIATKSRDESESMRVERGGKFDPDCNRLAMAPVTETVQTICKIFERSVLRHHKRNGTVFERHRHAAWPRPGQCAG
jgi:hypothetical protein